MNIGVFIKSISPEAGGGFTFQETVVNYLVSQNSNHKITIFHYGMSQSSTSVKYVSMASCRFSSLIQKFCFEFLGNRLQLASFYLSRLLKFKLPFPYGSTLDRQVRKHKIDFVIFLSPEYEQVEVPYICTIWDLEHRAQPYFPEMSSQGEWKHRERFYNRMLKRASYVITGTKIGKDEICRFFGVSPERIRLLPHPTPGFALKIPSSADPVDPEIAKLLSSEPFIFYPAQFWAHKNHLTLLLAIREMKQKVNLALVGSDKGNLKYIKGKVEELGLSEQVYFLGFVSRKNLISLYKNAVAMVYPSLCGPENLPPLEAFALGCPVIASDIPGSREQLGENALLVKGDSPQEFSKAISSLLADEEKRTALIQKGDQRARGYTEKEFVRDLYIIIEEFAKIRSLWKS